MSFITATHSSLASRAAAGGDGSAATQYTAMQASFSQALEKRLGDGGSEVAELFQGLRGAFSGVSIFQGSVASGVRAADAHYRQFSGDAVSVDAKAATALSTDRELADRVQDAIAAFLGTESTLPPAIEGTTVQRTVTVTVTTVRFSVFQRVSGTGETVASGELSTSLDEKLRELIARLFGRNGLDVADEGAEEDGDGASAMDTVASSATLNWSVELFYSRYSVEYYSRNSTTSSILDGMLGSSSGFAAVFSQMTGSLLPSSLAGVGSSDHQAVLASLLSGMGASLSSSSQSGGGFLFLLTAGASLSLWDMLGVSSSELAVTMQNESMPAAEGETGDATAIPAV